MRQNAITQHAHMLTIQRVRPREIAPTKRETPLRRCRQIDGVEVDVVGEAQVARLALAPERLAAAVAHEVDVVVVGGGGGRGGRDVHGSGARPGGVVLRRAAVVAQHVVGVRLRERRGGAHARCAVAQPRAQLRQPAPHAPAACAGGRRSGRARGPRRRRHLRRRRCARANWCDRVWRGFYCLVEWNIALG